MLALSIGTITRGCNCSMKSGFTSLFKRLVVPLREKVQRRRRARSEAEVHMVNMWASGHQHPRMMAKNPRATLDKPVAAAPTPITRSASRADKPIILRLVCRHDSTGTQIQKGWGTI